METAGSSATKLHYIALKIGTDSAVHTYVFGWQPLGEAADEAGDDGDTGWEIHVVTFRRASGTRCSKLVLCSGGTYEQ